VKRGALLLTMLTLLLASPAIGADGSAFESGVFEPPREAPDFLLQGSNGSPIVLSKLRGKVVAIAFGFSYCPRICPVTLARLSEVFKDLGTAASEVQVLFVTVDPERDTPGRLREFLQFFHPTFLGATGDEEQLKTVRQAYGILATKAASENKKLGYEVHHSSSLFLIDREGKLRVLVPFGRSPGSISHDIKLLINKSK
jgi:protein SCO1